MAEQLLIGDVTALTGVASGRIRHYDKIGLLRARYLSNGYRVFDVGQVLDLLRIDLLRSLGVSIKDIQRLLGDNQTTLADMLGEHRALLITERDRLNQLVGAIDAAIGAPVSDIDEVVLWRLATSHRDSIGVIGRLSTPLAPPIATMYAELFRKWELPVPGLFGQMMLPPAASTLLAKLAETPGRNVLFDRLHRLTVDVVALGENHSAALQLANEWIEQQLADPWPHDVVDVLRRVQPELENDPVIVQGFHAWAASITPAAADFIGAMSRETARRGLVAISVIVLPAAPTTGTGWS